MVAIEISTNWYNGKIIIIRKISRINVFSTISFILIKLIIGSDNIKVKDPLIPNIINKENGNEISIKMKATKDIAKNYSGFGYVSQCSNFNIIDEKQADIVLEKKIQDGKLKGLNKEEIVELEQNFETLEKHRIFKKNEYDEPSHFEFTFESECRVKPGYLFYKAIDIIDEKLNL